MASGPAAEALIKGKFALKLQEVIDLSTLCSYNDKSMWLFAFAKTKSSFTPVARHSVAT
jgi:hypothetical protein